MRKVLYLTLLLSFLPFTSKGTHLIGADLFYDCLGQDGVGNFIYRLEINVYRDCLNGIPPIDNPLDYNIYEGNSFHSNGSIIPQQFPGAPVPITTQGLCLNTIPNVCVERGNYIDTITLPPSNIGYQFTYQQCCRNNTIQNIQSPSSTGASWIANFPPTTGNICNSSARFTLFPPIVICANNPLYFNHIATDPDGDSLVYKLCDPFDDNSFTPPFSNVTWIPPYNINNQIGGTPAMNIDSLGILRGFPNAVGQYVVGICVEEWRNGVLFSEVRRDFQFNITTCDIKLALVTSSRVAPTGELIIFNCEDFGVPFINQSIGATTYFWDFGDPTTLADTSNAVNPTYFYPDTGQYYVTLIADPGDECADTADIILNLYPGMEVFFDTMLSACANENIQFTDLSTTTHGTLTDWLWDFGDNNTSTDRNPTHTYLSGGNYLVKLIVEADIGCVDSFEYNVLIDYIPQVNFTVENACIDVLVSFKDSSTITAGNIASYLWNFGHPSSGAANFSTSKNATHTYNSSGSYNVSLVVITDAGCRDTLSQTVTIFNQIFPNAGADVNLCFNDSITLNASGGAFYRWSPDSNMVNANTANPTVAPKVDATYIVEVMDSNGCTDFDTVMVNVILPPVGNASKDTTICYGDTINLNAVGGVSYLWDANATLLNANLANPVVFPLVDTTYYVNIYNALGCFTRDSVRVTIIQPTPNSAFGSDSICERDSVMLTATGGDSYSWSPAVYISNPSDSTPYVTPPRTTTFTVTINKDCFTYTHDVTVYVYEIPYVDAGDNETIVAGETIELQGGGGQTYEWLTHPTLSNANSRTPSVSPLDSTTYYFQVWGDYSCSNIDSVTINVVFYKELLLPNAFSPNGDGLNDELTLIHRGIRELHGYQIFNRWGQMVFSTTNLDKGWDGYFNGEKQGIGNYAYYASASTYADEVLEIQGSVILLR